MIEREMYIYLVVDRDRFKVGYSKDPHARIKHYKTHSSYVSMVGIFKVVSKEVEKSVRAELLKLGYDKCNRYPRDEWFKGEISVNRLQWVLDCLEAKRR